MQKGRMQKGRLQKGRIQKGRHTLHAALFTFSKCAGLQSEVCAMRQRLMSVTVGRVVIMQPQYVTNAMRCIHMQLAALRMHKSY